MWAGRLRQSGSAFAALGPARNKAMLKGKLKGCSKGAGFSVASSSSTVPAVTRTLGQSSSDVPVEYVDGGAEVGQVHCSRYI